MTRCSGLFGLVLVLVLLSAGCLGRDPEGPTKLTTSPAGVAQVLDSIDLDGRWVVSQRVGTRTDVVNRTPITTNLGGIYLLDLETRQQVRLAENGTSPRVSANRVVWSDGPVVRSYDTITRKISTLPSAGRPLGPAAISGFRVVWAVADRNAAPVGADDESVPADIALYSAITNTTTILPLPVSPKGRPDIDETRIVWADARNGTWDVYLYDLLTGSEYVVTDQPSGQFEPKVAKEWVAWLDNRDTPLTATWRRNLYAGPIADLTAPGNHSGPGTTTRGSSSPEVQLTTGGNVVAFDLDREWVAYQVRLDSSAGPTSDIRLFDLQLPTVRPKDRALASDSGDEWAPALSGDRVVWVDGGLELPEMRSEVLSRTEEQPVYPWTLFGALLVTGVAAGVLVLWSRMDLKSLAAKRKAFRPQEYKRL